MAGEVKKKKEEPRTVEMGRERAQDKEAFKKKGAESGRRGWCYFDINSHVI